MEGPFCELEENASLPALFYKVSALHRLGLDKATPLHLDQALVLCRRFAAEVRAADLFSANEEAEDLATADIKYLLAPFFLAELLNSLPISSAPIGPESSPPETGPAQRMLKVEEALMLYTAFLDSCRQYGLLGQTGRQLYLQDAQQLDQMDPSSKRTAKIEQFKASKALSSQLAELEERRARASKHQDQDDGSRETGTSGLGAWDEEDERALWSTTLQQAALRALQQRQMLKEERELLQHALVAGIGSSRAGLSSARQEIEQDMHQEVLNKLRGIASSLATPSGRREELRSQVFRPGHLPPTRTLTEQAEIEVADAQRREASQRAQQHAEAARREALGSDEDEEELQRTRAFDDFKDTHPRGFGNSKLRPCG